VPRTEKVRIDAMSFMMAKQAGKKLHQVSGY
jgi:hypothetical protein